MVAWIMLVPAYFNWHSSMHPSQGEGFNYAVAQEATGVDMEMAT